MRKRRRPWIVIPCAAFAVPFLLASVMAQVVTTPAQPPELPIEVETELGPGSLKQAPLWKELVQLLENPYAPIVRRPGFGAVMPPLNVFPLDVNPLTGQPLRLRTSDGEISWDQPGPLFDPDQALLVDAFNVPLELRTVIGELVVDATNRLVVLNPAGDPRIPPDGTIVAVPATNGAGQLVDIDGNVVTELETPRTTEVRFLRDRSAAEVLGKALFWDMQVGSDGVQACGSCHFHAGADDRRRNQLNPNTLGNPPDTTLQVRPKNSVVRRADFPFHKLADPDLVGEPLLNPGNVVSDANDVMSSMGVLFRTFVDIPTPGPEAFVPGTDPPVLLPDIGVADPDPVGEAFQGVRRVEPRNTPTFHNAAFNFDNFWDGRARHDFNGGSVFGPSDPAKHVLFNFPTGLEARRQRIHFSSLASQAVGPPLSEFEMSFHGRNWAKIGKKLLQPGVVPLANQLVHRQDSVLGPYSNQRITPGMPGLSISYPELIQQAFLPVFWDNLTQHLEGAPDPTDPFDGYSLTITDGPADPADTNQFTQMEANFSLFFGLAVQAYEELTIADDSPFDRFMDANPLAANAVAQPGEQGTLPPETVRELATGSPGGELVFPDADRFGPDELFGFDIFAGANLTAALPVGSPRNPDGFGSNPFLRTARCMQCHIGPEQTDAGDFPITNAANRDANMIDVMRQAFAFGRTVGADLLPFANALPDAAFQYNVMPDTAHPLTPEPANATPEEAKVALVKFLISLTDERVRFERAPFDHPEIFVPRNGRAPDNTGGRDQLLADPRFQRVAPVGAQGRRNPLRNFLGISSTPVPGPNNDHFDR